ncbi:hypothetical protein BST81_12120 [Leptolyngbya sp. 'hensonii']|uniref:tetratricopeptide repeat protein n=1 Tax=Leptolyngbya sp. 'hensonii' TaxID=1922337 RepID=UPI00094FEC94|nr:tetratricopeptide repeat protein [Leptolyngbya sp. 'hensonii']OLP17810.1 hypothetical protein BST81_12120 [Leptolyngbya sp. 'hensonii']
MTAVPSPQPPTPKRRSFPWWAYILLFLGGCTGFGMLLNAQEEQQYDKALKAYQAGDCETALKEFNQLLKGKSAGNKSDRVTSARAKKAECDALGLGEVQQKAGKPDQAIVRYTNFAASYPSSPLRGKVQQSMTELFQKGDLKKLAQPGVCNKLKVLIDQKLVPDPQKNGPPFYQACGQQLEAKKQYTDAVKIYEMFLAQYPKHALEPQIKAALARSLVAEARAAGAGNIPAPGVSGYSGSGATTVVIQNETPNKLRIVFSGPQPRFEELAPCPNCVKFKGRGPSGCPNKGPVGTYTLKPGNYDVVVKTEGGNALPFTGKWALGDGSEYNSCFFIVQRSSS